MSGLGTAPDRIGNERGLAIESLLTASGPRYEAAVRFREHVAIARRTGDADYVDLAVMSPAQARRLAAEMLAAADNADAEYANLLRDKLSKLDAERAEIARKIAALSVPTPAGGRAG